MAKKKAKKKATKKKAVPESEASKVKNYMKDRNKYIGDEFYPNLAIQLEKLKKFSVGDILHLYDYDAWGGEEYKLRTYSGSDYPCKHKVIGIDKLGFPHIAEIMTTGHISDYISPLVEHIECGIDDLSIEGVAVDNMIKLDPDFLDATIMGIDYDPIAEFILAKAEKTKKIKEKVAEHFNLLAHNKKLKIHVGSARGRAKFVKEIKVGDERYCGKFGLMTLTIKQDDMMVFNCDITDYGLQIFTEDTLNKTTWHSKEPESMPYVEDRFLKKYGPKKS